MRQVTLEFDVKKPPLNWLNIVLITVSLKVGFSAALSLLELIEYSQKLF